MFCMQCGAQILEGAKFCTTCGTPVAVAVPPVTQPASTTQPAPTAQNTPQPQYAPQPQCTQVPQAQHTSVPQAQSSPRSTPQTDNAPQPMPQPQSQSQYAPQPMPQAQAQPQYTPMPPAATPTYQTPQQIAQAMYNAQATQAVQSATLPASIMAPNPWRAVVLAGVAVLLIFVSSFYVFDLSRFGNSASYFLLTVAEACGLYLMMQRQTVFKIAAGATLFLSPFFYANHIAQANTVAILGRVSKISDYYGYQVFALFEGPYWWFLVQMLVVSLCLAGAGILLPLLLKDGLGNSRRFVIAGIGAGVSLIIGFLMDVIVNALQHSFNFNLGSSFLFGVVDAVAFFGAFLAVGLLCELKSYEFKTGTGAKVWFWVVTVFSAISFFVLSMWAAEGDADPIGFLEALFYVMAIVGYVLLIASKRVGYIVVVFTIGIMFFVAFAAAISALVYAPDFEEFAALGSAFSLLINPAVTSLVVFITWKNMPEPLPAVRTEASTVFKVFAPLNLSCGLIGALIFAINAFTLSWSPAGGHVEYVVFCMFGVASACVGLFATIECFRAQSRVRKGLQITNIVFAVYSVACLILAIVMLISQFN